MPSQRQALKMLGMHHQDVTPSRRNRISENWPQDWFTEGGGPRCAQAMYFLACLKVFAGRRVNPEHRVLIARHLAEAAAAEAPDHLAYAIAHDRSLGLTVRALGDDREASQAQKILKGRWSAMLIDVGAMKREIDRMLEMFAAFGVNDEDLVFENDATGGRVNDRREAGQSLDGNSPLSRREAAQPLDGVNHATSRIEGKAGTGPA
jgi:hypothetical protein